MESLNNKTYKSRIEVSKSQSKDVFGLSIPLRLENENDLKRINYSFIKFQGIKKFEENGMLIDKYFIEFANFPKSMIIEICNIIQSKIEDINQKSVADIIKFIVNLFSSHKLKDPTKKLFIGDLSEALFILKVLRKFNINISKYYCSEENLYDFYISKSNYYLEIKSSPKANGKIIIDKRQIEESKTRDFFVVEYQFIQGKSNILDIYQEIGFESEVIKNKYDFWHDVSQTQEMQDYILKNKTVEVENVSCFQLDKKTIPIIDIKNGSAIEKMEITLNISGSRELGLNNLLDKLQEQQ